MDTVGNKYTLGVPTGLAARPSQSFLLALLDLSVNLHQVLLSLELLGPLKPAITRSYTSFPASVAIFSILLLLPKFP